MSWISSDMAGHAKPPPAKATARSSVARYRLFGSAAVPASSRNGLAESPFPRGQRRLPEPPLKMMGTIRIWLPHLPSRFKSHSRKQGGMSLTQSIGRLF